MSNLSIDPRVINKSEIARRVGYSYEYVRLLLKGERKNKKALQRVIEEIQKIAIAA